jgi:hypothetical protein
LYDKFKSQGVNLKDGILDSQGDPVVLRPLNLKNDMFYYIKTSQFTKVSKEEMNPVIGIVTLK